MTSSGLLAISLMLVFFASLVMFARHFEAKAFNKGICKNCNNKLRHFDNDSQGGRGYVCDKCGYTVWVSYKKVDKNFVEEV